MRQLAGGLALILFGLWFQPAVASQTVNPNYDQVRDNFFWDRLNAAGGVTLYCDQPFIRKLGLEIEYVRLNQFYFSRS